MRLMGVLINNRVTRDDDARNGGGGTNRALGGTFSSWPET